MCDENEVEQLLANFQAALDALNKVKDVEGLTLKLDTHNKKKLLKKVKSLVSEVYGKVSSIRETVSKAYKKAKLTDDNKEVESSCTADLETSVNDAGRYSPVIKKSKFFKNVSKSSKEPDKADTSEAPPETHSEVERLDQTSTSAAPLDVTDTGSDIIENTPPAKLQILLPRDSICGEVAATPEADPLEESGAKETDVLSQDNCETTVDNGLEDNERPEEVVAEEQISPEGDANSFPKIKVVDISKLLAPKVDTPKGDYPAKGRKSVTFDSSVVVLTSSDEDTPKKNPQEKELSPLKSVLRKTTSNTIDLSDSDSKENNENLRNNKKNTEKQIIANKSSDESDCDHYSGNKRLRRIEKNIKDKFSSLIERRKSRRAEKDKDDSSDEETSKTRKVRSHGLKEKSLKKRKKQESDGSAGIQKLSVSMALDDPKFKCEVHVPLPRFSCEELPELYEKQKELFEVVKKKTDEGSNKKLTLTIKVNQKHKGKSVDPKDQDPDQSKAMNGLDKDTSHSSEDGVHESVFEENGDIQASEDENGGTEDEDSGVASTRNKKKNSVQSDSEEETDSVKPTEAANQKEDAESENAAKSRLLSSDSDEDFVKLSNKRDLKFSKRSLKKPLLTDSESETDHVQNNTSNASDSDKETTKKNTPEDKSTQSKTRINKRARDSSSDDDDKTTRKHLRKMIDRDSLSETTRKAEQKEKERKARIAEKQRKYNQIYEMKTDATVDHVILDFDEKTEKPLLSVDKSLTKQLKPHQVQGIKFMWDASFESLEQAQKGKGSGCILAHCMGLGKTLQVITLVHTLLTNKSKTKVEKILVVCPVNTVLNWMHEFKRWIPDNDDFPVYELVTCKTSSKNQERKYIVKCWHENGGVLIIGYNMFRNLSNPDNKAIAKNLRTAFQTGLVDPGPDLVVCDEGHLLKNEKTNLSIAMNRIKTARRIVLTGTPLQNNLREYWCMVQFIKPNLLGTYKEYMNRFVNPITNGQYTDSTQHDIMVMRRRSHVLHKLLDGVVQRQDYAVLEPYLPPKHEYVLFLKLTELQTKLYKHYMDNFARRGDGSNRTSFLFTDFQELQRICTHPRVLLDKSIQESNKKSILDDDTDSEGSLRDFIDDSDGKSTSEGNTSDSNGSCSDASIKSGESKKKKKKGKAPTRATRVTRAQAAQRRDSSEEVELIGEESGPKQWWEEYVDKSELDNINHGTKIFTLFQILKECEEIGDKVLVFSQSLYTLNSIEYFLNRIDEATQKGASEEVGGHTGSWSIGLDYFRLDGSSSCDNRASWCDQFNDPENTRARLFLISTKAGGLGINLVAANRVIIFDVSWNPSHDIQSIYRVYRFGQTKPTYIYRFVTYGAMEMKIYERQVTKQAISKRVIDEQQIDRHYSQNDIQELYKTDLEPEDRPIPLVPKDVLLGEMLQVYDKVIFKYHEHQSLLEDKQDEQLNEDERKAAWDEFENEKVIRKTAVANFAGMYLGAANQGNEFNFSPQMIQMALANMVRKDNPHWTQAQIKNILPGLVAQLQIQLSQNNLSLYNKVQQELRMMQALQAQRMRENMLKQYHMQQMLQQNNQQLANQLLGNLNITPEELRLMQMAHASQNLMQTPQPGRSNEIIDLNN